MVAGQTEAKESLHLAEVSESWEAGVEALKLMQEECLCPLPEDSQQRMVPPAPFGRAIQEFPLRCCCRPRESHDFASWKPWAFVSLFE